MPGSRDVDGHQHAGRRRAPPRGGRRTNGATARTGWGVTVSATRSSTPGSRTVDPHAGVEGRSGATAPVPSASGATNTASSGDAGGERLAHDLGALEHEGALGRPHAAAPHEPAQALDLLVAGPEGAARSGGGPANCVGCGSPAGLRRVGAGERGPGHLHQGGEGGRLGDGQVGEDLAVDLDPGVLQAVDEPAVADMPCCGRRR